MLGKETPKPSRCSPRCGWPELSTGKEQGYIYICIYKEQGYVYGVQRAELGGWMDVGWGFCTPLSRNAHSVTLTGVLMKLSPCPRLCCNLHVCHLCSAFCICVRCCRCAT